MVIFKLFLFFCIYADGGRLIKCEPITLPYEFANELSCKRSAVAFAYSEAIKLQRRYNNVGAVRWVFKCKAETSVSKAPAKPRLRNSYE